jgi:hypothetical protein
VTKDTPEQQAEWVRDPKGYLDLCKRVENDINAKFKLLLNDTPQAKMAKEVRHLKHPPYSVEG